MKPPSSSERSRRIIKRYSNRKLYDTRESRYVTLLQIAGMVRAGEDVQIIDNASKEDKTEVTLALIISEELKSQPRSVPLGTLRDLIHQRGEKLLTQLREGPIARLIPGGPLDEKKEELMPDSQDSSAKSGVDGVEARPDAGSGTVGQGGTGGSTDGSGRIEGSQFEHWRHTVDERIRMILPSFGGYRDLQAKVEQLSRKVADLEAELARRKP
ncbi:MAG TPA: polyhydroxyalkanoate synthesis regulator DNA-binding domain-containing protein [Polyangiaceae bacterium]|nr:polyhydroxyalkanoate synthesis regulator DNA-binding domain-containing protein [Polyangiaceae bacterium]